MGVVKERLRAIRNAHLRANEFLFNLSVAMGHFDPDYPPTYLSADLPGLSEECAKHLWYVLDTCRSWRSPNDPFPREFSAVQAAPVECCGEIEANAHWLTWVLSRGVFLTACETIKRGITSPGSLHFGDPLPAIKETDFLTADWRSISRGIFLGHDQVTRLQALVNQEYERAVDFVKSQARSRKQRIPKPEPQPATVLLIVVSHKPPQVSIDGVAYAVNDRAATLMQAIVDAQGDWVSGHSIVNQPSRVVALMPESVRKLLEPSPGKGYRLRRGE